MAVIHIELELDAYGQTKELVFFKSTKRDNQYQTKDGKILIGIERDRSTNGWRIHLEKCQKCYQVFKEEIIGQFELRYAELLKIQQENYESGFENIEEEEEPVIKVPYNPALIAVAPARFSLREIVGMLDGEEDEEPVLDLAPDFQRDYVWDNLRKSRLIESILLNIPLPVFYFARNKEGKMQVVDGVQRLTTIYKFFHNEFRLTKLEYLKEECEGKYFKNKEVSADKNLRPKLIRALRQYQIDCNIIEPSTPENVKLDIFKRLNTGGKELNKQEIRHAFMKKEIRIFVRKLAEDSEFLKATDNSINDKRMMAQELVMRYIGFYCLYMDNFLQLEYSTKMDEFIDTLAVQLNMCKKIPYEKIAGCFTKAMKHAHLMFGNQAFRKIDMDTEGWASERKNPINKSLFIAFSILLSSYSTIKIRKKGNISQEFAEFLYQDKDFYDSISHNTNYQLRETAIGKVQQFLEKIYGETEKTI